MGCCSPQLSLKELDGTATLLLTPGFNLGSVSDIFKASQSLAEAVIKVWSAAENLDSLKTPSSQVHPPDLFFLSGPMLKKSNVCKVEGQIVMLFVHSFMVTRARRTLTDRNSKVEQL